MSALLDLPAPYDLSHAGWALAALCALGIGLSKAGLGAAMMLVIPAMALLFGARPSVGLVLPLLVFADLLVFRGYRSHATWRDTFPLLFPAVVGILAGWALLGRLDEPATRVALGITILAIFVLTIAHRLFSKTMAGLPESRAWAILCGWLAGLSTTLANAAGPIFTLYLVARGTPKYAFLGIAARFFLLINLIKVPFNVQLGLINASSLSVGLALTPAVVAGVFLGKRVIDRIPQGIFNGLMIAFALIAGLKLTFF